MRKLLIGLSIGGGLLLAGFVVLSRSMTTDPAAFETQEGPPNPLPACPGSPNCVRTTWVYAASPDELFVKIGPALIAAGAGSVAQDIGTHRVDAVFTVFLFNDDVAVAIEPYENGAAVHIRSASRTGHSDLGVNGRRVKRIKAALEVRL